MIHKEVDYAAAIQQWQTLINGNHLTAGQKQEARYCLAGLQAEKDMAYHLKVFFADRESFAVFHNLKIEHNGLTAQIDHLLLTRWTAYFIESKSVSQVISVNEHGEWGRIHNRRFTPIESPVEQSRRHKETLYNFLYANRKQFQGSFLGLSVDFRLYLTPVHYVAISTHGQITGRGRRKFPDVKKADQVPHAIQAYHESLDIGLFSRSSKDEDMSAFSKKSFATVVELLLRSDVAPTPEEQFQAFVADLPSQAAAPPQAEREASAAELGEDAEEPAAREYACRKCESRKLAVTHGQYGYYFKCADCGGNTPIVELCPKCSEKLKVSKSGNDFSLNCPKCGQSSPLNAGCPEALPTSQSAAVVQKKPVPAAATSPACPLCCSTMTLRTARHGKNAGGKFWGCDTYPKCRGIVQATA